MRIEINVPSKDRNGNDIDSGLRNRAVSYVMRSLTNYAGGCHLYDSIACGRMEDGTHMTEPMTIVCVYASSCILDNVRRIALRLCQRLDQESVFIAYDGIGELITESSPVRPQWLDNRETA